MPSTGRRSGKKKNPIFPGQILVKLKLLTMAENRQQQQQQQQQNRKIPHHCPCEREEIRRLTKKSSLLKKEKNWTEPERKQGQIVSFQRWRELQDL